MHLPGVLTWGCGSTSLHSGTPSGCICLWPSLAARVDDILEKAQAREGVALRPAEIPPLWSRRSCATPWCDWRIGIFARFPLRPCVHAFVYMKSPSGKYRIHPILPSTFLSYPSFLRTVQGDTKKTDVENSLRGAGLHCAGS